MADIKKIKLGTTTYNIVDANAARTDHTHDVSIAASSGTNELTLAHGTKYAITVGGDSFVFTMPTDNNTNTDRSSLAYCSTAAGTAAKTATMPGFALSSGQYIFLRTTVKNSATSSVTLNVNSTGAKPVKIGNSSTNPTASNFPAGDYLANYDGTNWILTRIYLTDTIYSSKTAASGGTDVSLVTTGEKYNWNAAEKNVQSDWSITDTSSDAFIKNKPTSLKNPNSITIKAGSDTVSSYDGSAAKTFTFAASSTAGAFTISDGTTTKTVQLAGKFTDNNTDTKNTAGSTDSSSKLFLIGATSQAANPQTYSHDTAYVGTDGCLYSGGSKVLTSHQDISGKQDKLTAQTAYTSKGSATKVPQITTNSLGQVTGITEVTITQPTVNNGKLTLNVGGAAVSGNDAFTANDATNTTYNVPSATASAYGVVKVSSVNSSAVTVNSESTTAGRYYPVELNSDGKAIVNVPWTDTDTNTWRGIQDNLTSTSTTDSLSAKQGKELKALIDGKANASHGTHVTADSISSVINNNGSTFANIINPEIVDLTEI